MGEKGTLQKLNKFIYQTFRHKVSFSINYEKLYIKSYNWAIKKPHRWGKKGTLQNMNTLHFQTYIVISKIKP